jgi:hypothetical protein
MRSARRLAIEIKNNWKDIRIIDSDPTIYSVNFNIKDKKKRKEVKNYLNKKYDDILSHVNLRDDGINIMFEYNEDFLFFDDQILLEPMVPVGTVVSKLSDDVCLPYGFLNCDGGHISKDEFPQLYEALAGYTELHGVAQLPNLSGHLIKAI